MAFVNTTDKITAIKALLNDWLKDPTIYCGNCGMRCYPSIHVHESCCENPMFGRNIDHTMNYIKANKQFKKNLKKATAESEGKNMRMALNLPPQMYTFLNNYFKRHGEQGLFNDVKEMRKFMRAFPCFTIPDSI